MRAIRLLDARHRLVRRVLTSNMTAPTPNARLLVDLRDHLVVDVQVLPVGGIAYRPPGKFGDAGVALAVHPA
ncbi:hypothetical protein D3C76_1451720 [compost metagenome]